MPSASLRLPEGYTFFSAADCLLSVKGKEIYIDLCKQAQNRDPDAHDMYIYNDYFSYAVLDLIDTKLATLNGKVIKKKWDESMPLLEAITLFSSVVGDWSQCDDGERAVLTNQAYGALLVNILRGLKKENRLDPTHFPSLESILKIAAVWGGQLVDMGCDNKYHLVCKAIGKRLFNEKPQSEYDLQQAQFEEWKKSQGKDAAAEESEDDEDDDEDEEDKNPKAWFKAGKLADEDKKFEDVTLSRIWKEYKEYLRGCPTLPLKGPPEWDITKWSAADKKRFLFSEMDNEMDDF